MWVSRVAQSQPSRRRVATTAGTHRWRRHRCEFLLARLGLCLKRACLLPSEAQFGWCMPRQGLGGCERMVSEQGAPKMGPLGRSALVVLLLLCAARPVRPMTDGSAGGLGTVATKLDDSGLAPIPGVPAGVPAGGDSVKVTGLNMSPEQLIKALLPWQGHDVTNEGYEDVPGGNGAAGSAWRLAACVVDGEVWKEREGGSIGVEGDDRRSAHHTADSTSRLAPSRLTTAVPPRGLVVVGGVGGYSTLRSIPSTAATRGTTITTSHRTSRSTTHPKVGGTALLTLIANIWEGGSRCASGS